MDPPAPRPTRATDHELTAHLAEAVALRLPDERLAAVSEVLAQLLAFAATLEELPLEDVEPASTRPGWQ
jgi:Asp-tRNA(Asn)/Glu-tRNA(Gln) amidotransferase C subunit